MNEKFRVLDLFSGIGGFSLGLERTGGFETVAFCEIEPYCRRVLAKHWPNVPCYTDVRELTADTLRRDGIAVDVICGGFPCQDISVAGGQAGIEGARSGLWSEYRRLVCELRPRFVLVENVANLLTLGLGTVLGDLAALGYDAVWDCIPASAIGAPHRRDRLWLVAYANGGDAGTEWKQRGGKHGQQSAHGGVARELGDARGTRSRRRARTIPSPQDQSQGWRSDPRRIPNEPVATSDAHFWADADWIECADGKWRPIEPGTFPLAHGVSKRMARCRAAGNAVVPQIPELIGRAILEAAA